MEKVEKVELGTKIGDKVHTYPGLAPLAKKFSDLSREVAQLESAVYELNQVRATLLLNFGNTEHNRYGICIDESLSTLEMLMVVLNHTCRPYQGKHKEHTKEKEEQTPLTITEQYQKYGG